MFQERVYQCDGSGCRQVVCVDRSQKYPPGWYVMQRVTQTGRSGTEAHFCSERCLFDDVERRKLWLLATPGKHVRDQTG